MQPGLAVKPIESGYGLLVVNITQKIPGKQLEYTMVADKVCGYLVHRASHLGIQSFIQSLVAQADSQGITLQFAEENIYI